MTVTAIVQARMSSSRFPGKVLAELDGMPMLAFMIRRLSRCRSVDRICLATSAEASDDPLAAAARDWPVRLVRGPLDDVLGRFGRVAEADDADAFLRLTGDCPLIDPETVDALVALFRETGADYASNIDPPSFPDGLDCEIFSRAALDRALAEATTPFEREHVTPWMRRPDAGLVRANLAAAEDLSALRLTVDHPEDLEVVRSVVARLGADAGLAAMVRLLREDAALAARNPFRRNEGSGGG